MKSKNPSQRTLNVDRGPITMQRGNTFNIVFSIDMIADGIVGKVIIEDLKLTYRIVSIQP